MSAPWMFAGLMHLTYKPWNNTRTMNTISMSTDSALTPNYVLLHGKTRLAPTVLPLRTGKNCSALYGFSDKAPYDLFRSNSEMALTPFPLVKVYLRTLIEAGSETLHLVIMDATSPSDVSVRAASMESVLKAQLAQTAIVLAEYSLTLDKEANGYRVDESS